MKTVLKALLFVSSPIWFFPVALFWWLPREAWRDISVFVERKWRR